MEDWEGDPDMEHSDIIDDSDEEEDISYILAFQRRNAVHGNGEKYNATATE